MNVLKKRKRAASMIHGLLCAALCLMASLAHADESLGLPGLVNTGCDPQDRRTPIVLIHGTFANAKRAFSSLAPVLKARGYCLFALNYGRQGQFSFNGSADINVSAQELSRFVQSVLMRTGAEKVSLIGHSQGGLLAFKIARLPELLGRIDRLVAIAPSLHGTTRVPASLSSRHCPACAQQSDKSSFMMSFHQEPVSLPGVRVFILATRQDVVVTPVERQFLDEPGVTNVLLQDLYPEVRVSHSGLMHTPEAIALTRTFLELPADR